MEDNKLIEETIQYVKDFFENEFSGHDFYHTLRVYNVAKTICNKEGGDSEIVLLSALLHDVDDVKLVGVQEENCKNAKAFLRSKNYPEDKIERICHIIDQISFKGKETEVPDTLEGKIVQDADRLDAIGAIGIARVFAYGGNKNRAIYIPGEECKEYETFKDYTANKSTSINHFYEKLLRLKDLMNTQTAKEIAQGRHNYMEVFLDEFYAEWDGKK